MSLQLVAASYIYIQYALKRGGRWWRVTLPFHNCSGLNRIITLLRRPNTDSTPNKPVKWPRNKLLIRYGVTSCVHTVTIWCYVMRCCKCATTLKKQGTFYFCVAWATLSYLCSPIKCLTSNGGMVQFAIILVTVSNHLQLAKPNIH